MSFVIGAVLATAAGAQPSPAQYSADDFAKAIQSAPCQDGEPRDAGGACPSGDAGATRGFTLLRQKPVQPPGQGVARSRPDPVRISPRAETSPLSDLRISFALGSAKLLPAGEAQARALADTLKQPQFSKTKFELAGYTDATGSPQRNVELSDARAQAVRAFLVSAGVDENRLTARGYGEEGLLHPDRPNDPSNRRVEAKLLN